MRWRCPVTPPTPPCPSLQLREGPVAFDCVDSRASLTEAELLLMETPTPRQVLDEVVGNNSFEYLAYLVQQAYWPVCRRGSFLSAPLGKQNQLGLLLRLGERALSEALIEYVPQTSLQEVKSPDPYFSGHAAQWIEG